MAAQRLIDMLTTTRCGPDSPDAALTETRDDSRTISKRQIQVADWDILGSFSVDMVRRQTASLGRALALSLVAADFMLGPDMLANRGGEAAFWARVSWTAGGLLAGRTMLYHIAFHSLGLTIGTLPTAEYDRRAFPLVMARRTWEALVAAEAGRDPVICGCDSDEENPTYFQHPVTFVRLPVGEVLVLFREPDPERDDDGKILNPEWVDRSTAVIVEVDGLTMHADEDEDRVNLRLTSRRGIKINPATGYRFMNVLDRAMVAQYSGLA